MTPEEVKYQRVVNRLERRDRKIAGLERKIVALESALAKSHLDFPDVARNLVKDALNQTKLVVPRSWR